MLTNTRWRCIRDLVQKQSFGDVLERLKAIIAAFYTENHFNFGLTVHLSQICPQWLYMACTFLYDPNKASSKRFDLSAK